MGGQYGAIAETEQLNQEMEQSLYGISKPALAAGTSYLTGTYARGGYDQSAKYQAQQTMAGESPQGGSIYSGNLGTAAGQRASTFAGIGGAKIAAGVDEMNKIRAMLGQQGLKTTNLAQEAGGLSLSAIPQMAKNPTLSTILGIGAAGASIYGGVQQANQGNQVASVLQSQQYGANPAAGSDQSFLLGYHDPQGRR